MPALPSSNPAQFVHQPYGIREFSVQDVNGVGIVFGQDVERT
jgi:hypothetical protein